MISVLRGLGVILRFAYQKIHYPEDDGAILVILMGWCVGGIGILFTVPPSNEDLLIKTIGIWTAVVAVGCLHALGRYVKLEASDS